jgi:hypothetical protein
MCSRHCRKPQAGKQIATVCPAHSIRRRTYSGTQGDWRRFRLRGSLSVLVSDRPMDRRRVPMLESKPKQPAAR